MPVTIYEALMFALAFAALVIKIDQNKK